MNLYTKLRNDPKVSKPVQEMLDNWENGMRDEVLTFTQQVVQAAPVPRNVLDAKMVWAFYIMNFGVVLWDWDMTDEKNNPVRSEQIYDSLDLTLPYTDIVNDIFAYGLLDFIATREKHRGRLN